MTLRQKSSAAACRAMLHFVMAAGGIAAISLIAPTGVFIATSLIAPGTANACHNYSGPGGRGCGAYNRDKAAGRAGSNASSSSSGNPPSSSASRLSGGNGCSGYARQMRLGPDSSDRTIQQMVASAGARASRVSAGGRASLTIGPNGKRVLATPYGSSKRNTVRFYATPDGYNSASEACFSFEYYYQPGSRECSRKLVGIYSGRPERDAGGVPARSQLGAAFRILENCRYGVQLYTYQLDRKTKWGQPVGKRVKLKTGWNRIVLKASMGNPQGTMRLTVNGTTAASIRGDFGASRNWKFSGVKMSDQVNKYSGPSTTAAYYANMIYAWQPSKPSSRSTSSSSSQTSRSASVSAAGEVAITSPSSRTSDTTPTASWRGVRGAKQYIVKVVDLDSGRTAFNRKISSSMTACSGSDITCAYTLPRLPRGVRYRLAVREAISGSKYDTRNFYVAR